jgi:ArsR family transcriptional regulator, arsenate/arsenite/antimonite-responsive transcriptional repressor
MNMAPTVLLTEDLFAALADRVRLRIACCLSASSGELCVCELGDALQLPQPTVSRQLRIMKNAGLVDERREGRWMYYRLSNTEHPLLKPILCCVEETCSCGDSDIQSDLGRLKSRLALRQGGKCVVGLSRRS